MPVPVAYVVGTEPCVQEIEQDLLPIRIRREVHRRLRRVRAGRDHEGYDELAADESPLEHAPGLGFAMLETLPFDRAKHASGEDEDVAH